MVYVQIREISPRKHVEKPTDFQMFVWLELLMVYGALYKPIKMASVQASVESLIQWTWSSRGFY